MQFFLLIHCDFILTSIDYFIAAAALYLPSLAYRIGRTAWRRSAVATIEVVNERTLIVDVPTSAQWGPGQHFFLRFGGVGLGHLLSSAPFTASSLPAARSERSVATFVIRGRRGLTARLASRARSGRKEARVWLDGPYGQLGFDLPTARFDHALLLAGGAGIAFILPLLDAIIRALTEHASFGSWSSVRLIWATRDASASAIDARLS